MILNRAIPILQLNHNRNPDLIPRRTMMVIIRILMMIMVIMIMIFVTGIMTNRTVTIVSPGITTITTETQTVEAAAVLGKDHTEVIVIDLLVS